MPTASVPRDTAVALQTGNCSPDMVANQLYARPTNRSGQLALTYKVEEMQRFSTKPPIFREYAAVHRSQGLNPYTGQFRFHGNNKWLHNREGVEAATVKANQGPPASLILRQLSPNLNFRQGYPNANIGNDNRACKVRERNDAAQRAQRASRTLNQIIRSARAGGYSPLALHILSATQRKARGKGATTTPPVPQQTSHPRQLHPQSRPGHEGGHGAGLTQQQRTGPNPTARRPEVSDLTESPDAPGVTEKEQPATFIGAGIPASPTIAAGPVQRKRKRCDEDDSTREESLRQRR
ncbi:hypothetical protein F4859DRAFT_520947 [Xylaria cf. heliscus]|nr:hypothetical protein F4859DRAFT_520947 [Xylaria cf. heliscus]